jgi:peptidoglycan hydrolase-like protein with peptidoglycan-binding domain
MEQVNRQNFIQKFISGVFGNSNANVQQAAPQVNETYSSNLNAYNSLQGQVNQMRQDYLTPQQTAYPTPMNYPNDKPRGYCGNDPYRPGSPFNPTGGPRPMPNFPTPFPFPSATVSPFPMPSGSPLIPLKTIFTQFLKRNSRGKEVSALHEFLKRDAQLYPEALVTGFFGPATERAVQRFQTKYNLVTKGTPATTGYGTVGPKTRNQLNILR